LTTSKFLERKRKEFEELKEEIENLEKSFGLMHRGNDIVNIE
jgi:hypothetical protein